LARRIFLGGSGGGGAGRASAVLRSSPTANVLTRVSLVYETQARLVEYFTVRLAG